MNLSRRIKGFIETKILNRMGYVSSSPNEIHIEITNRCNLKCKFCFQSIYPDIPKGIMGIGMFRSILLECHKSNIDTVNLFNLGESMTHPNFIDFIKESKRMGVKKTILYTNGTLVHKYAKEIFESGLDEIRFSFDTVDKERYEKLRGANFDLVSQSIIDFIKMKKALNFKKPYIICQQIYNHGALDIDDVEVFRYVDFFATRNALPDDFKRRPFFNQASSINPKLEKELGIKLKKGRDKRPCPIIFTRLAVQWDGKILACCRDYGANLVIGEIGETTLKEAWNCKRMRQIRRANLTGVGLPVICRRCDTREVV